jgi:hypothetical protein
MEISSATPFAGSCSLRGLREDTESSPTAAQNEGRLLSESVHPTSRRVTSIPPTRRLLELRLTKEAMKDFNLMTWNR